MTKFHILTLKMVNRLTIDIKFCWFERMVSVHSNSFIFKFVIDLDTLFFVYFLP